MEILTSRLKALIDEKQDTDYKLTIPKQAEGMKINYQTFNNYINENKRTSCPDENLVKIARYYNVSTDYLLGLTPNRTTDASLAGACEYTGLTEKAAETVRGLNHEIVSAILESSEFAEIVQAFSTGKQKSDILNPSGDNIVLDVLAKTDLSIEGQPDSKMNIPKIFKSAFSVIAQNGIAPLCKQICTEKLCQLFDKVTSGTGNK